MSVVWTPLVLTTYNPKTGRLTLDPVQRALFYTNSRKQGMMRSLKFFFFYSAMYERHNIIADGLGLGSKILRDISTGGNKIVCWPRKWLSLKHGQTTLEVTVSTPTSHTVVFILPSVGILPLILWYRLQCGSQEGSGPVHGLLSGWGVWEMCWLFPEIPTLHTRDTQVVPLLYSGL